jgi:hypothetical protein
MIVVVGLVILVAAVVAGVAGVLGNGGSGHSLTHFGVLGYHVTGSTGTLFLYGIVLGAVGLFGLGLLLAGARRTARRGREARRGLRQSRRETAAVSKDRDDLIGQRETARAYTASTLGDDAPAGEADLSPARGRPSWRHLFGRRSEQPREVASAQPESSSGEPVPDVRAAAPVPDVPASTPAPTDKSLEVSQP